MNPEFRRNLWLEMTPRRLMTMTIVLLLIFFATALSGSDWTPPTTAALLYYFIVVLWGARNAALSVVGEIRDRTWDLQRLSSLSAAQMTWGKLFGSTIFNWYGGVLCLAVVFVYRSAHQGPLVGLIDVAYYVIIGLIAQAVAFLASLVATIRRQSHTRLEVFVYQATGLVAAVATFLVWNAADPAASLVTHKPVADIVPWWGHAFNTRGFLLLSLAAFAGWTLLGCYREMRLELKMRNGPFAWLAFLAFMGVYVAGFDAWLPKEWTLTSDHTISMRLALAAWTYGVITYVMVLLEPKDRVLYRWLGEEVWRGNFLSAARSLQGWMMSCKACFVVAILLIAWLVHSEAVPAAAFVGSALGFLTRDVAIFVLLQALPGQRRGDFAALLALFALYVLAPAIADGLGLKESLVVFYPEASTPIWLSPVIAWVEALTVAGLAVGRLIADGRSAAALPGPKPRVAL